MSLLKSKIIIFLFLTSTLFNEYDCSVKTVLSGITSLAQYAGVPYAGLANKALNFIPGPTKTSSNLPGSPDSPEDLNLKLLQNQERILIDLENIQNSIEYLKQYAEKASDEKDLSKGFTELEKRLKNIDSDFKKMLKLKESGGDSTEFKNQHRDENEGSREDIRELYSIVFPVKTRDKNFAQDRSLMTLILNNIQGFSKMCNSNKSQQSLIKGIFDKVTMAKQKVDQILKFCFEKSDQSGNTSIDYQEDWESITLEWSEYFDKEKNFIESFVNMDQKIWRCDHNTEGLQWVSGYPVIADANHVIVGARLVILKQVLHIQIQQGKILPNGAVDENVFWKRVEEPNDPKNDPMIYVLSYSEFQGIYLGPSKVEDQRVLVGVQIVKQTHELQSYLAIRTLSLAYDYAYGSLMYENSFYQNSQDFNLWDVFVNNDEFPKFEDTEINFGKCNLPIESSDEPIHPVETSVLFAKFVISDLEKNFGQSFIRFVDTQEIISNPSVPLTSINFYLKKSKDDEGFIGLTLETYNSFRDLKKQYDSISEKSKSLLTDVV